MIFDPKLLYLDSTSLFKTWKSILPTWFLSAECANYHTYKSFKTCLSLGIIVKVTSTYKTSIEEHVFNLFSLRHFIQKKDLLEATAHDLDLISVPGYFKLVT